jgi:hypothetical protein
MSSKKQITIDPGSLSDGHGHANNTTLKRQRKTKPPVALLRPNTVKKNLLEKIKDYKRRNEETPSLQTPSSALSDKDLANQFKSSSNYLEQLMKKKKDARKHAAKPAKATTTTTTTTTTNANTNMPAPVHVPVHVPVMQPMPVPVPVPVPANQNEISLVLPPELQVNPLTTMYSMPQSFNTTPSFDTPSFDTTTPSFDTTTPSFDTTTPSFDTPSVNTTTSFNTTTPSFADVPYGCLRNGMKPTYRTYHRNMTAQSSHSHTLKRPIASTFNAPAAATATHHPEENPMIQERQRKLRELQERATATSNATPSNATPSNATPSNATPSNATPSNATTPMPPPTQLKNKIKQTITKKYKLGRTPGSNVVGVFIKNNETRRQVQEEHGQLKREPIIAVRKYLHDHGLLKVGSDAPPDVLRNMYETAKLTGEVNNVNKHVILHNFIATADKDAD